jgi:hypothetical protein
MTSEGAKYAMRWGFAILVFGSGFYGIVLYEYALDDLTKGALISLMTLAAQFVFGEAIAASSVRRSNQSFDAGVASTVSPPPSATPPPDPPLPDPTLPDPGYSSPNG